VIAAAIAGHMVSGLAPLNSREVIAEKRSSWRLSLVLHARDRL
jgi:hypothetical protein